MSFSRFRPFFAMVAIGMVLTAMAVPSVLHVFESSAEMRLDLPGLLDFSPPTVLTLVLGTFAILAVTVLFFSRSDVESLRAAPTSSLFSWFIGHRAHRRFGSPSGHGLAALAAMMKLVLGHGHRNGHGHLPAN